LVAAFIAGQVFKTLRTYSAQKTLREALTRGVTITPEMLIDAEKTQEPGANDLRNGMVLIALHLPLSGSGSFRAARTPSRAWWAFHFSRSLSALLC